MSPGVMTSLEALGIAIRAALDASELYTELTHRAGNSLIRDKLLLLAREEQQHQRILEETYQRRFPDVPLELPRSQLPSGMSCQDLRAQLTPQRLLSCAIEQERRSREFYLHQADLADDTNGRRMFNFLADWEFSHQMELAPDYELLTRFPRHFDRTSEPWKAEFRR